MVSGSKPKGFICKNKGYLSGWTKVPQEGPINVKCCSCEISLILSRYYCMLKSLHKRASKNVSHIAVEWYVNWSPLLLFLTFHCRYLWLISFYNIIVYIENCSKTVTIKHKTLISVLFCMFQLWPPFYNVFVFISSLFLKSLSRFS